MAPYGVFVSQVTDTVRARNSYVYTIKFFNEGAQPNVTAVKCAPTTVNSVFKRWVANTTVINRGAVFGMTKKQV